MAEIEARGQNPEPRIIVIKNGEAVQFIGPTDKGAAVLSAIRAALASAADDGSLEANPFVMDHTSLWSGAREKSTEAPPPAGSEHTLADLNSPKRYQDYFIYRLGMFLGKEPNLPLPSQEYVEQGKRIKNAGFTTYQPVAAPDLTIIEGFEYPENWQFPLDPWIYQQITNLNLKSKDLDLKQMYGWLDVSPGLDWQERDPMFDPSTDKPLVELLTDLRKKGRRDGIEVVDWCKHLDPGSFYGISAKEARNAFYPAIAQMIGVGRREVRNLKAAEFNFIGNYLYFDSNGEINLGGANSWIWLENNFGAVRRLIAGHRGRGGLSRVFNALFDSHLASIRVRTLVAPPSAA